jgi:hypothetical protein
MVNAPDRKVQHLPGLAVIGFEGRVPRPPSTRIAEGREGEENTVAPAAAIVGLREGHLAAPAARSPSTRRFLLAGSRWAHSPPTVRTTTA